MGVAISRGLGVIQVTSTHAQNFFYFIDGAASHFKNKSNFINLCSHDKGKKSDTVLTPMDLYQWAQNNLKHVTRVG